MSCDTSPIVRLFEQMDGIERLFFLDMLERFSRAKSKNWKTRHLRAFDQWYRERRGIPLTQAREVAA